MIKNLLMVLIIGMSFMGIAHANNVVYEFCNQETKDFYVNSPNVKMVAAGSWIDNTVNILLRNGNDMVVMKITNEGNVRMFCEDTGVYKDIVNVKKMNVPPVKMIQVFDMASAFIDTNTDNLNFFQELKNDPGYFKDYLTILYFKPLSNDSALTFFYYKKTIYVLMKKTVRPLTGFPVVIEYVTPLVKNVSKFGGELSYLNK